jgi:hypothetical protein
MDTILYPSYFSPIIHYVVLAQHKNIVFEVEDHFQKQTYRNRCYIYGANGKQLLNIPVRHNNITRKTKDVRIEYAFNWQKQHIKTIQTAYRSSPYFEYYEEDMIALFKKKPKYLLDLNFRYQEQILGLLQLDITFEKTIEYHKVYSNALDLRHVVNAKNEEYFSFSEYFQAFSNKHGFIENLSILDLLFMEGPSALTYLEEQEIN